MVFRSVDKLFRVLFLLLINNLLCMLGKDIDEEGKVVLPSLALRSNCIFISHSHIVF